MADEIWLNIPGTLYYQASDRGNIRNLRSGRLIRQYRRAKDGRKAVSIRVKGVTRTVNVSTLVCRTFHGEKPFPDAEVAHGNGNNEDNRASNLSWKSHLDNEADKIRHGTAPRGQNNSNAKLSLLQVIAIREDNRKTAEIARDYGVSQRTVQMLKSGHRWSHVPATIKDSLKPIEDGSLRYYGEGNDE